MWLSWQLSWYKGLNSLKLKPVQYDFNIVERYYPILEGKLAFIDQYNMQLCIFIPIAQ